MYVQYALPCDEIAQSFLWVGRQCISYTLVARLPLLSDGMNG
jgi:hypothetical protein